MSAPAAAAPAIVVVNKVSENRNRFSRGIRSGGITVVVPATRTGSA
jgi:hypothetical protein